MIRDRIPQPWHHVLKEERMLTKYINLVYATHCRSRNMTKDDLKFRISRIKEALKESNPVGDSTSFWYSFNNLELVTIAERKEWEVIDRKIQNYKISCG